MKLILGLSISFSLLSLSATVSLAQLTTGFTFSRSYGKTNSSNSSSSILSSSRVLGKSCRDQLVSLNNKNKTMASNNNGCITLPENVIALPQKPGKIDQFKIVDTKRAFSVSDTLSSKTIDDITHQKSVNSFNTFGYSVFSSK